jgi:hypothetical protein
MDVLVGHNHSSTEDGQAFLSMTYSFACWYSSVRSSGVLAHYAGIGEVGCSDLLSGPFMLFLKIWKELVSLAQTFPRRRGSMAFTIYTRT